MIRRNQRLFSALMMVMFCAALVICCLACLDDDCHRDAATVGSDHCGLHCVCHGVCLPAAAVVPPPDLVVACPLLEKHLKLLLFADSIFQPPRA
jgi:hypothetical protein